MAYYGNAQSALRNGRNSVDPVINALSKLRDVLTEAKIQILKIEDAASVDPPNTGTRIKVELYFSSEPPSTES